MTDAELIDRLRDAVDFHQMAPDGADVLQAANRIEQLTEQLAAARDDAKEAEAYAEELEAKLAKAVEDLTIYIYETTHLSAEQGDGSHWCKISKDCLTRARATLAEIKGP